jgi:hypothetical protein
MLLELKPGIFLKPGKKIAGNRALHASRVSFKTSFLAPFVAVKYVSTLIRAMRFLGGCTLTYWHTDR